MKETNKGKEKTIQVLTLAFGIAFMPPLWAVLAPYIGITTGAVALICAGIFAANGNRYADAPKICIGFLCGDCWAAAALFIMERLNLHPDIELYLTLFILGGLAVIFSSLLEKYIFLPAWLCGWAIGLTIMVPAGLSAAKNLSQQIGAAMIVGVIYVGIGVDLLQKALLRIFGIAARENRT
ncbi:MAG: DUF1097 domain-containing protein [Enterocloster citroniae]|nr:DUF1097 domain-containing protein [Enterocloster citroniae]